MGRAVLFLLALGMAGAASVPADYVLTPSVVFSEDDAGAVGAAVSGVISRHNPLPGSVASGLKFQEAQTSMLLTDARRGVQVAAAEGSTRKADLQLSTSPLGTRAGGTVGGYGKTNEGKIIAAAMLDNFNNVVTVVRGMRPPLLPQGRTLRRNWGDRRSPRNFIGKASSGSGGSDPEEGALAHAPARVRRAVKVAVTAPNQAAFGVRAIAVEGVELRQRAC